MPTICEWEGGRRGAGVDSNGRFLMDKQMSWEALQEVSSCILGLLVSREQLRECCAMLIRHVGKWEVHCIATDGDANFF